MTEDKSVHHEPITPNNPPAPHAPVSPPPTAAAQVGPYREDPGQTLGIIGLVANTIGIPPAGIVLGVLSRNKSRQAGFPTTLGTISMIWGIVSTAIAALVIMGWIALFILSATNGHGMNMSPQPQGSTQDSNSSSYPDQSNI